MVKTQLTGKREKNQPLRSGLRANVIVAAASKGYNHGRNAGGAGMSRLTMSRKLTLGLALMVFAGAGLASAPARAGMKLYVTNSEGDNITVIDLATLKVVGEIKVGEHVHGAAVQADGRRLFATVEAERALKVLYTATH